MGFRINTNIAAMAAHNNATMNNRSIDQSLGRLSSGLRINTAADDASGLVIANSLRSQANSLGQAVNNGNDAIGLIQTADGALDEYSKILDTIKTKSIQAASDGQNQASRLAIQKDIDRLMEELDIIATTTSFNGQKLLSGTFVNKEFQMGANANESVKTSIASTETSQIGQTTRARLDITTNGENQLSIKSALTGEAINLESFDLQANNDPANGMGAVANQINRYSGTTGITAKAVVEVTTGTITAGTTGADFAINGVNIGAINVDANDAQGTLLNAINAKTTETGVAATKNSDGTMTLTSADGRAIAVTGDVAITGSTTDELSTKGFLEVVQAGSSTFAITGAEIGAAVGNNITISGDTVTVEDSILAISSNLLSDSVVAANSVLGFDYTADETMNVTSSTKDSTLTIGSIISTGSILDDGTTIAGDINVSGTTTLSSSMFLKAGSTLGSDSVLDAGTVLQQDFTFAGVDYKAGTVLTVDVTLTSDRVLSQDMTMFVDESNPNAAIAGGSTLTRGSVLGADITLSGSVTLGEEMTLQAGSVLESGSVLEAGSSYGDDITTSGGHEVTEEMLLKTGSTLASGNILGKDSTIGGTIEVDVAFSAETDMLIKAGSTLNSDSTLKAGTVLNQDLTDAQVGGGVGSGLKAGTVLGTDVTLTADVILTADMTFLKGDTGTAGKIEVGSVLTTNAGFDNSVVLSEEDFTNLSDIDVTTLEGAMKAIDTLSAAILNLDTIRSDLGSVQNQIVSTINNISVTQVNVKAAESQIRDVDFAAESANFSRLNILAQSGSYAMSQANAVQQNVLRLLQ